LTKRFTARGVFPAMGPSRLIVSTSGSGPALASAEGGGRLRVAQLVLVELEQGLLEPARIDADDNDEQGEGEQQMDCLQALDHLLGAAAVQVVDVEHDAVEPGLWRPRLRRNTGFAEDGIELLESAAHAADDPERAFEGPRRLRFPQEEIQNLLRAGGAEAGGIGEQGLALLRDLSYLALELGQFLLPFAALMVDGLFLLLQPEGDGVRRPEDRLQRLVDTEHGPDDSAKGRKETQEGRHARAEDLREAALQDDQGHDQDEPAGEGEVDQPGCRAPSAAQCVEQTAPGHGGGAVGAEQAFGL
jgi:hypothetical protein